MIRYTLIDLNFVERNYYPFMITLHDCSRSCNVVDDLSMNICVPSKTKDENIEVFNMITVLNEAKTLVKHFPCDCKCKLISTSCNSNQEWNNDKYQREGKKCRNCKNDYSWNTCTCICENGKYLKSIADT